MIRDEERRLRRAFRSLLLLSLGAPAAVLYACSSSSGGDNGATPDASSQGDGTTGSDTGSDGSSATDSNAGDDSSTGQDGSTGNDASVRDGPASNCPNDPDANAGHPRIDGAVYLDAADDGACDYFFDLKTCMPGPVAAGPGCYFKLDVCASTCGFIPNAGCFVPSANCRTVSDGGTNEIIDTTDVVVDCTKCLGGRRPEAMEGFARRGGTEVGAWFAQLSHLEGASIAAFRTLRAELVAHRAPRELVLLAERSAKDEVRHTRATARLARRFGATPKLAKVRRGAIRSLEALAIENAAEGCVRETFGALLAAYQAVHAEDADVRAQMAKIADDETRHAALAWAVAEWASSRLDDDGRARVAKARAQAIRDLMDEVDAATPASLVATAGLPTAAAARALVDGVARALWS